MGTGYKKSEATKERVLKAAYEQFSTYGYHGASLREIATLCGISHPGIRHHFPTKEDLFIEVLRERDSRVRSIVETWIAEKGVSIEGVVEIARQNMTTHGLLELFTATAVQVGWTRELGRDRGEVGCGRARGVWCHERSIAGLLPQSC